MARPNIPAPLSLPHPGPSATPPAACPRSPCARAETNLAALPHSSCSAPLPPLRARLPSPPLPSIRPPTAVLRYCCGSRWSSSHESGQPPPHPVFRPELHRPVSLGLPPRTCPPDGSWALSRLSDAASSRICSKVLSPPSTDSRVSPSPRQWSRPDDGSPLPWARLLAMTALLPKPSALSAAGVGGTSQVPLPRRPRMPVPTRTSPPGSSPHPPAPLPSPAWGQPEWP